MFGTKSKVIVDSIDLKILETLNDSYGIGVIDLAMILKLSHKNLKVHLEKLIKTGLIKPLEFPVNDENMKLVTVNSKYIQDSEHNDDIDSDIAKYKRELEIFDDFMKILKKIESVNYENETLAKIVHNLNKKERSNNKPKKQNKAKKSGKAKKKVTG